MANARLIRFTDCLGTGASLVFGAAGLLFSTAVFAADNCVPAMCTPSSPNCQQCQQVFEDAALKLKNLDPGSCTPSGCAAPAAASCEAPTTGCTSDGGCPAEGEKPALGTPWMFIDLFTDNCGKNKLKDNGWQIGGWTSFGYQNNPDGAFTGNGVFNNDYYGAGFNNAYEWDRFQLNQQGLYIGKVADGSKGLGFGFRAEFIYGADGNEFQSFGNNPGNYDFSPKFNHGIYEYAIPQLYGEVAYGNTSVKIGHFYTPVGYEVLPNTGQFFMSRQLTFYNSEPFTHTGVLATTKVNDKLQLVNGWVLGMDTGFDRYFGGSSYLGGFIWQANEKLNVTNMLIAGDLGWRGNGAINSLILTYNWTDKLQSVHQFDVLGSDLRFGGVPTSFGPSVGFPGGTGIPGDSIGQINYLFYTVTDRVKAGVRQEWYKADGVSYYEITYGVNVKPMANLVIRPEVRHMWSPNANNVPAAPGRGDLFNQTVFGVDAVLSY